MIVIEKNAGPKIPWEEDGFYVTFDDELTLKLSKYQKDDPVHKDICYDADGDLQIGTKGAKRYVAELDIPARQYETVLDEDNNEVQEALPLDMDEVTLTLWAIA